MDGQYMRECLLKKELGALYVMRGEQYTAKEERVDDIIANDDGSLAEEIELEGSFLFLLMGKKGGGA